MINETLEIIARRRSVRAYRPEPIERAKLEAIVEAGQFAPNGSGMQQWHFSVAQNRALLDDIDRAAKDAARESGLPHLAALGGDPAFRAIYGAPALVLVSSDASNPASAADCACAVQNMLIAAESLGVGGCFLYFPTIAFRGAESGALRARLAIPDGYEVFSAACFGYAAGPSDPPAPRREGAVSWNENLA